MRAGYYVILIWFFLFIFSGMFSQFYLLAAYILLKIVFLESSVFSPGDMKVDVAAFYLAIMS